MALLAGLVSRFTTLREDASFASFYLTSLAAGVLIVSLHGSSVDLLHVLFGTILAIDSQAIFMVGGIASFTLIVLALADDIHYNQISLRAEASQEVPRDLMIVTLYTDLAWPMALFIAVVISAASLAASVFCTSV